MKRLDAKTIRKIKAKGRAVKTTVQKPRIPPKPKTPKLEQSLSVLNGYVKQIIIKKDHTETAMSSISKTLDKVADKIDQIQPSPRESIKAWNITVEQRDGDNLIKSLSMKAG